MDTFVRFGTLFFSLGAPSATVAWVMRGDVETWTFLARISSVLSALGYSPTSSDVAYIGLILIVLFFSSLFTILGIFFEKFRQSSRFAERMRQPLMNSYIAYLNTQIDDRALWDLQYQTGNPEQTLEDKISYHTKTIKTVMRNIREAFSKATDYKDDLRATIMIVAQIEGDTEDQLYIEFWSNQTEDQPLSHLQRVSFPKTKSYCGKAWRTMKPVVGTKKRFFLFPDPDYLERDGQRDVKCFFCNPVMVTEKNTPLDEQTPVLWVLNLDSTRRRFFPRRKRTLQAIADVLQIHTRALSFHIRQYLETKQYLNT